MKKRILFVNRTSKLGIGTSTTLLLLIKYLCKEFDCAVVSDKHFSQFPHALEMFHVPHHALPDRVVLYLPALIKLIILGKFDLIYANGSNERSRGALWAAKLTRRPIIWHIHESLKKTAYAGTIRFADAVIANSKDTAERIRKFAYVSNPYVVYNGVELQDFNRDKQKSRDVIGSELGLDPEWLRVINIGNICRRKNQIDLIYAASQILALYPKTYFILVGNYKELDYLEQLKRLVNQCNIKQNIIFHDYTPNVGDYLCGSDLMLHTAETEPQGIAILEAMAADLPVVAYRVGGIGESIVDGESGFLVPFGDVNGLTQTICRLINNPQKRKRMGDAGYQRIKQNFTAEMTVNAVLDIICQTLQQR